ETLIALEAPAPLMELPEDETLAEAETEVAEIQGELTSVQQEETLVETEVENRPIRLEKIPEEIATAQTELTEVDKQLAALPTDALTPLQRAMRASLQARKAQLEQRIATRNTEKAFYESSANLLNARRDHLAQTVSRLTAQL